MRIRRARTGTVLLIVAAVGLAACGSGTSSKATSVTTETRVIAVDMTAMAFQPANLNVTAGETIKFVFTNRDTVDHDAFIGDAAAQTDHAMKMNATGSAGDHAMGAMTTTGADDVTVKPGKTATLTMTFDRAGTTLIGCHEVGHYEAGMKATVTVT